MTSDDTSLIRYYMGRNIQKYMEIEITSDFLSKRNTPYYELSLTDFKNLTKIPSFPNVNSKIVYQFMFKKCQPRVERLYPLRPWPAIWKQVNFRFINIKDREIIFKFIHDITANNKRLFDMKIRSSPYCDSCQIIDDNAHRFYHCQKIKLAISWLKRVLEYISSMRFQSIENLLVFNFPNISKKVKNSMCIIVSNYISVI